MLFLVPARPIELGSKMVAEGSPSVRLFSSQTKPVSRRGSAGKRRVDNRHTWAWKCLELRAIFRNPKEVRRIAQTCVEMLDLLRSRISAQRWPLWLSHSGVAG